jgi:iron complex transport system permease protein
MAVSSPDRLEREGPAAGERGGSRAGRRGEVGSAGSPSEVGYARQDAGHDNALIAAATCAGSLAEHERHRYGLFAALGGAVLVVGIGALAVGRYSVPVPDVFAILAGQVFSLHHTWSATDQDVVLLLRLPRVLLTMLVGGALALCGAVLQAVLRNPVADPQLLGVSYGASFGGALAILLGLSTAALVGGAFGLGMVVLVVVFVLGRSSGPAPTLTIVLSGIVTGAFFSALVSFTTYLANPETQLQSIVFWLLGSFATSTYSDDLVAGAPILLGAAVVLALRWRVNVLSLGDDDARSLGVNPQATRWCLLVAVAVMSSASVAVSGAIGWVGLVTPHLARPFAGADHRRLLPASALIGAGYLTFMDTLARTVLPSELPVGILTAVVGAPSFFLLLRRHHRRQVWVDA